MKATITIAIVLALSLATNSQEAQQTTSHAVLPLCTMIQDSSTYTGQEIVVRGLYQLVMHGAVLMGKACGKEVVNLRQITQQKPQLSRRDFRIPLYCKDLSAG